MTKSSAIRAPTWADATPATLFRSGAIREKAALQSESSGNYESYHRYGVSALSIRTSILGKDSPHETVCIRLCSALVTLSQTQSDLRVDRYFNVRFGNEFCPDASACLSRGQKFVRSEILDPLGPGWVLCATPWWTGTNDGSERLARNLF